MTARFVVTRDIDVTIHDNLATGRIWVEVEVKVAGPDQGKHVFEADLTPTPDGAVKVKGKDRYRKLGQYVGLALRQQYEVLL